MYILCRGFESWDKSQKPKEGSPRRCVATQPENTLAAPAILMAQMRKMVETTLPASRCHTKRQF